MISYVIYTIFVVSCVILIMVVLLQPGKGDVASALGGGTTGAAFGPRGATSLLAKITIAAAICFMGIAFLFSVPGIVTPRSVTSGVEVPTEPEPIPGLEETAPIEGGADLPEGAIPAGKIEVGGERTPETEMPAPAGNTNAPAGEPAQPAPTPGQ